MSHLGVRAAVRRRAKGRCEICGHKVVHGQQSLHHRKMRRIGGKDTVLNLIFTHRTCHDEIHRDETYSGKNGWVAWLAAEITPFFLHRKRWVVLTSTGEYAHIPAEEAQEILDWVLSLQPPRLLKDETDAAA